MARKHLPDKVTPIRHKRKARTKGITEAAQEDDTITTHDGPIAPLDPVERYAWDRVWDWFIETTRPYVLAYAYEEAATASQREAA